MSCWTETHALIVWCPCPAGGLSDRWERGEDGTRRRIASWVADREFDLVLDARHAIRAVGAAIWSLGIRSLESSRRQESTAVEAGHGGTEAIRAGIRAGWGLEIPADLQPRLRLRAEDRAFAADMLREMVGHDRVPFAVSPVASHAMKRWPVERFAAVADHVVDRGSGPVLVLEGPQPEQGALVVEAMEHSASAIRIGHHHLLRTAVLIERCRALVCNDTGLMHMAGAVLTPAVGVFGPTRAEVFLPPGPGAAGVEPSALDCGYRDTRSLSPPACWQEGRCFIGPRSCIHQTRTSDVTSTVDRILDTASRADGDPWGHAAGGLPTRGSRRRPSSVELRSV